MSFMIQALRFIIFGFLISNIVTKPENLSIIPVSFDKHINVETKNICNTTSGNDTYIITKKKNDYYSTDDTYNIIAFIVGLASLTTFVCICIWEGTRCECNIQYIRRNCSRFRECCVEYTRNFPNAPPTPVLVIRYRPQAADYRDIYQMPDGPV